MTIYQHTLDLPIPPSTRPRLSKQTPPYYWAITALPPDSGQQVCFQLHRSIHIDLSFAFFALLSLNASTQRVSKSYRAFLGVLQRQLRRGLDFPKLDDLNDYTTAHFICTVGIRLPLSHVFGVRCSRATPINHANFSVTLCLSATALFLPHMHPFGCNYWLKLSIDPQFPVVPLHLRGRLHPVISLCSSPTFLSVREANQVVPVIRLIPRGFRHIPGVKFACAY